MNRFLKKLGCCSLSAILSVSACTDGGLTGHEAVLFDGEGTGESLDSPYLSWDADTGAFYSLGEWIGTVQCSDLTDPRIDGDDAAFSAFLDEKCTLGPSPLPPPSEPCASGYHAEAADGSWYELDTCVPTSPSAPDPYTNAVASWVRVPDWATNYDAECSLLPDGSGCCNFYVPIDPAELSACDVVLPVPLFAEDGGGVVPATDTVLEVEPLADPAGLARVRSGGAARLPGLAVAHNDGPTPPPPGPPPGPSPDRQRTITARLGGLVMLAGIIVGGFNPEAGRVLRELGERVVRQVQRAEEQQRRIQRQGQQRPAAPGAPPEPGGPPTGRFQRGGRLPPTDPRPPTIPPRTLPPGGRPVTRPGQVAPQPPVRPPVRPRGG